MKLPLIAIALICLFYSKCVAQVDTIGRKHYPTKSCRIVFRFFNGPQSGTKTIIFDDWGNKEKEEVETITDTATMRKEVTSMQDSLTGPDARAFFQHLQLKAVEHMVKMTVNGERYIINLDEHLGAKSQDAFLFGGTLEENFKQMGFAFVRTDTLLGKPCKVWEQPNAFRLWVWKDFYVVKKEMVGEMPPGMRVEEYATEIDESYSIKPDEFKIPENIKFR